MLNALSKIFVCTLIGLAPTLAHAAPNILLILGDDMGAETLEAFGLADDYARTATLSSLAANGMKFTPLLVAAGLFTHARNDHDRAIWLPHGSRSTAQRRRADARAATEAGVGAV